MSKYIVIDPGHGGHDPGAVGFGIKEKDIVLALAKRMNDYFGQYEGVTVSLTRWDDRYIGLSQRADFANGRGADLFISLHNNAASAAAHGFESYVYNQASSTSKNYQAVIHSHIMNYLKNYGVRDRGKKHANFAVLRETSMPAILLENLFITNSKENQLLKDTKFLDELARTIVEAIAALFSLKKKNTTPKPMFRVTVDGKVIYDTAYHEKIINAVLNGINNKAKEIYIKLL